MPNEITTTYTFRGDDLPQFLEEWNKLKETSDLTGEDIASYFHSFLPEDYNPRCYVEDDFEQGEDYIIQMWDAWFPHEEIWGGLFDKYEELEYELYAVDNDNWTRGFVHTNGSIFRILYQDDEMGMIDYEYRETLNDAKRFAESYERYIIQESYTDIEDWDEELQIIEECGDTEDIRDYFSLE